MTHPGREFPCPTCDGWGYLTDDEDGAPIDACVTCGGTGTFEPDIPDCACPQGNEHSVFDGERWT